MRFSRANQPAWLSYLIEATPATTATMDPVITAQLLRVCEELLAATFYVLEHEMASERQAHQLTHLGRALGEVRAGLRWGPETEEDGYA